MRLGRTVFIGAGFSRPAGVPVGAELWHRVLAQIEEDKRSDVPRIRDLASRFDADVDYYARYMREAKGICLRPDEINFEEFLGFLELEHVLGFLGTQSYSSEGNETLFLVKHRIALFLHRATPPVPALPGFYARFAELLRPGDTIVTFNYDTLLERLLEHLGKPYALFDDGSRDFDYKLITVLKPHGSLDWFRRSTLAAHATDRPPAPTVPFDPRGLSAGPDPIVKCDGGLDEIYTVERCVPPFIAPPSTTKSHNLQLMSRMWNGVYTGGTFGTGLAVIGYSLPGHDDYARAAIYQVVASYQRFRDRRTGRDRKPPMVLIDYRVDAPGRAEYEANYRFVDHGHAVFHLTGFDQQAVDLLASHGF